MMRLQLLFIAIAVGVAGMECPYCGRSVPSKGAFKRTTGN